MSIDNQPLKNIWNNSAFQFTICDTLHLFGTYDTWIESKLSLWQYFFTGESLGKIRYINGKAAYSYILEYEHYNSKRINYNRKTSTAVSKIAIHLNNKELDKIIKHIHVEIEKMRKVVFLVEVSERLSKIKLRLKGAAHPIKLINSEIREIDKLLEEPLIKDLYDVFIIENYTTYIYDITPFHSNGFKYSKNDKEYKFPLTRELFFKFYFKMLSLYKYKRILENEILLLEKQSCENNNTSNSEKLKVQIKLDKIKNLETNKTEIFIPPYDLYKDWFVEILKIEELKCIDIENNFLEKRGKRATKKAVLIWYDKLISSGIVNNGTFKDNLKGIQSLIKGYTVTKETNSNRNEHPNINTIRPLLNSRIDDIVTNINKLT